MSLSVSDLAAAINDAIGALDAEGLPIAPTAEMEAYASAIIDSLQAGIVNHAVPGQVTGTTASGAPLAGGAAADGLITGLVPADWASTMQSAIPAPEAAANLLIEATASTAYLMASTKVNFEAGTIVGSCTSTPTSPGPLVAGAGTGGVIEGLSGSDWAAAVMPAGGDLTLSEAIYNAIVSYLQSNASASYATGTVTGTCPAVSGPLSAGIAAGGTVA